MADFSALTQQQQISAQIPYKNLALSNPAETFLNAWGMATNLRLKKSELEGKMAALAVKNRSLELDSQLDKAKFGLALQKADSDAAHKGNMYELAAQRLAGQDEVRQLAREKYGDLIDGQTSLLSLRSEAAAKGLRPGDPGYHEFMTTGAASLRGKLPPSVLNKFNSDTDKDETAGINLKQKALHSTEQEFMHRMSNTIYGNQANTDLAPVIDMETHTQPEYQPKSWEDWWKGTPAKPTDQRIITVKDATGKVVGTRKVPAQTLTDFNKEWQNIQQQKASIPQPPASASTMVNVRLSNGSQGTLPADRVDEAKQRDPGLVIIP